MNVSIAGETVAVVVSLDATATETVPDGMYLSVTPMVPLAFEQLTVSTSAIGLTAAKFKGAQVAVISLAATNGISFREDGTAPTASVGMLVAGGTNGIICGGAAIAHIQFIRSGGTDAVMSVTYYGQP